MAKTLTPELKKELLSLQQEKVSVSMMSRLFGKTTTKEKGSFRIIPPKFDVRATFVLEPGEYINKDRVETTVGSFLFNKLMIEGMLEHIVPNGYYNEVIDKKGFRKLIDMISEGLMMGKIPVNPTLIKWLKHYEFYSLKACTIFSPSYTEGLLRQNIAVQKEKAKLLKDRKIETPQDMSDIEDAIVEKADAVLKNDPGMTLFKSGARGSFDNDYKNMNLMLGPVKVPGTVDEFDMVTSNYIEGIQKQDIVACGNVVVNSAYPKACGTAESGYLTKQYYAAYQSIQCDEHGTDCGSKLGLEILLTKDNIEKYFYQYIIDGNKYTMLSRENADKWVNKKVTIRSPMFCKNDHICNICAGERFYIMGIKNVGLTLGRITNTLLNAGMKNFHIAKVKFDEVDVDKLLI